MDFAAQMASNVTANMASSVASASANLAADASVYLAWAACAVLIVVAFCLAVCDLPGNTLLMAGAVGFCVYDPDRFLDLRVIAGLALCYAIGEIWEFVVSFFGIRREHVPWCEVAFIAFGTLAGTIIGTLAMPVLGSVLGGALGAFTLAYVYEYVRNHDHDGALDLAFKAAKYQCLAMAGKLVANFAMAILVIKQVIFY